MSKDEEAKEQKKKKNPKETPSMNGVVITVYVESPTTLPHPKNDPLKRIKPNPFAKRPQPTRTRGYDRRAQLLAYVRELRDADSQQLEWPRKNSRPKLKKWRWSKLSFRRMFQRTKRGWRYERIVSEDKTEVDRSSGSKGSNGNKTRDPKRSTSHFCRRLKCMLKGLSSGWQCNKG